MSKMGFLQQKNYSFYVRNGLDPSLRSGKRQKWTHIHEIRLLSLTIYLLKKLIYVYCNEEHHSHEIYDQRCFFIRYSIKMLCYFRFDLKMFRVQIETSV